MSEPIHHLIPGVMPPVAMCGANGKIKAPLQHHLFDAVTCPDCLDKIAGKILGEIKSAQARMMDISGRAEELRRGK